MCFAKGALMLAITKGLKAVKVATWHATAY